ncbi:MAG: cupredoxin domain-containing protein [Nitrososphaeraceae archaeon]
MEIDIKPKIIFLLTSISLLTLIVNTEEINAEMKDLMNSTEMSGINGTEMSGINGTESKLNKDIHVSIPLGAANPSSDEFYSPDNIEVIIGTTVIWTNNDNTIHTVTSGSPVEGFTGVFDSGIMAPLQTFSYTFNNEGEFEYFCTLHPFMIGNVVAVQ